MISEILEILGLIATPIKKDDPKDSRKNFTIFVCYIVSAVCLIFIVPELKVVFNAEKPWLNVFINFVISCFLTFLALFFLRKLNLLNNVALSTFMSLSITFYLVFTLIAFSIKNHLLL